MVRIVSQSSQRLNRVTSTGRSQAAPVPVDAQAQQALVIQGGTLVDGNGGRTVANSFVVIQGNQIALDRLNNVLR